MKQLMIFILLGILLSLYACKPEVDDPSDPGDPGPDPNEVFETVGTFEMEYGPTELKISDNLLFACRDDNVFILNISNPESPNLLATFDDEDEENTFEGMEVNGNNLYVACSATKGVYVIDISNPSSPTINQKYLGDIYSGTPLRAISLFFDNGTLWAGGSNGQNALLVEYEAFASGDLALKNHWQHSQSSSGIEGIWANSSNVFISTANGFIHAFDKSNFANGPIDNFTFDHEPGHEHWGRNIVGDGNKLYWADWGAGFVSIDISNPSNMQAASYITHPNFLEQFPDAEGTDVYDITINKSTGKIYLANGWSGLLQVDENATDKIESYIDLKDNMYRCIASKGDYLYLGDIAAGTTDVKGIKVVKVK